MKVVEQKQATPVDINNDNNTDAYISVVETTTEPADSKVVQP
nr:hypothetical protein [Psychrobacter sp. PraFG1]